MHRTPRYLSAALLLLGLVCSAFASSSVTLSLNPSTQPLSVHSITLQGWSYDAAKNTTSFTYVVTSGRKPAISHWDLGVSLACAPVIVSAPANSFVMSKGDPTGDGFNGIKFDTGYGDNETRTVTLVLAGRYTVGTVDVLVKAGSGEPSFVVGQVDGPVCTGSNPPPPTPLTLSCPVGNDAIVGPFCHDAGKSYATVALSALPALTAQGGVDPVLTTAYELNGVSYTPAASADGAALQFPIGTTKATVTATSAATREAKSCSYEVYVDYCGPKLIGDGIIRSCSRVVSFGPELFSSEQGEIVAFESTPASGTKFAVGTTDVAFKVTDSAGNVTEGTLQVVVTDTDSPQITGLADIVIANDPGQCSGTLKFTPPLVIDCNLDTVTYSPAAGSILAVGTHTVTVTATDDAGNAPTTKSFTVTVVDREAPQIAVSNIAVATAPGECAAVVHFSPQVTDNCPGATVETFPASGAVFAKGNTVVKVIARDAAGNTAESEFTVAVADREAPSVSVPADIVVDTDAGQCSAVVALNFSAADNCPGVTVSSSWTGGAFPKGTTVVTVTAVDAAGNVAAKGFSVTVVDREAPKVVVPANITVSTAPGLCAASVPFDFSATDNCPGVEVSSSWNGGMFPKGATTVTVTAVDAAGNTTAASFTVTVVDTELPTISCPADIVAYQPGVASLSLNPGTATYADNCGATLTATRSDGAALSAPFSLGTTIIRWIATDDAGNSAWCEQKVIVANALGAGGGHTMGFWSNKNGQSVFNSASGTAAMLNAMNLRIANGSDFVLPTTAAGLNASNSSSTFSSWLNGTSASNMAYMLSGQLAAMKMNVTFHRSAALAKFGTGVNGNAYLYAPGARSANAWGVTTVNALMAEADAELGAHGLTPSGSPFRAYQEALKTALDRGNNNLNFVIIPN